MSRWAWTWFDVLAVACWLALPACQRAGSTGEGEPGDSGPDADGDADYVCSECSAATYWERPYLNPDQPDEGTALACYPQPIDFDEQTCQLLAEVWDVGQCPFEPAFDPIEEIVLDADDDPHTVLWCPIPQIAAPGSCAEAEEAFPPDSTEIGWYFCEDSRENFSDACNPAGAWAGIDEDGDGQTDCDDEECQPCPGCGGDGQGCADSCKYGFHSTPAAMQLIANESGALSCSACTDHAPAQGEAACFGVAAVVGRVCETELYDIDYTDADGNGWLDWWDISNHEIGPAPECLGGPCLDWHWTHDVETDDVMVPHFCTCMCADADGNDHATDPHLCLCPPGSICEPVCAFDSCPENIRGSFCMPDCIADPWLCEDEYCTPSPVGSLNPWQWTCE